MESHLKEHTMGKPLFGSHFKEPTMDSHFVEATMWKPLCGNHQKEPTMWKLL